VILIIKEKFLNAIKSIVKIIRRKYHKEEKFMIKFQKLKKKGKNISISILRIIEKK